MLNKMKTGNTPAEMLSFYCLKHYRGEVLLCRTVFFVK
ncbi:hypothetical protein DCCM_2267 [Desulfocucumis palustris]|uniref:Uncharacterized protein n=1 Tax=Desulfocucumis palustris TaxID=1898651 RepID=A0A2L2XAP8_9FIRM|nr:hypothetical protein DCCM_2267 [Desulfocucumis palustris]